MRDNLVCQRIAVPFANGFAVTPGASRLSARCSAKPVRALQRADHEIAVDMKLNGKMMNGWFIQSISVCDQRAQPRAYVADGHFSPAP